MHLGIVSGTLQAPQLPSRFVDERERDLIGRVLSGEKGLFYDLIAPYERRVYLAARDLLQSDAEAEDVAQETLLKGFRNLGQFRGEAKFSTWLLRIALNEARMRLRKRREISLEELTQSDDEGDYTPIQLADWREIPSEALARKELGQYLTATLHQVPEKYREVIVLRDVQGLNIAETAQALGLSVSNVKTRLLRARLMFRDIFVARLNGRKRMKGGDHEG